MGTCCGKVACVSPFHLAELVFVLISEVFVGRVLCHAAIWDQVTRAVPLHGTNAFTCIFVFECHSGHAQSCAGCG